MHPYPPTASPGAHTRAVHHLTVVTPTGCDHHCADHFLYLINLTQFTKGSQLLAQKHTHTYLVNDLLKFVLFTEHHFNPFLLSCSEYSNLLLLSFPLSHSCSILFLFFSSGNHTQVSLFAQCIIYYFIKYNIHTQQWLFIQSAIL